MKSRVAVNLLAVALVSGVLLLYAFSSLLAGALTEDTYPLEVLLPESGGLLAAQEVTLSGRVVGRVNDVRLEQQGVVAVLGINNGEEIPSDARVTVLRRSPIGEQALDFRASDSPSAPLQPGDRIAAFDAVTPVPVQRLLEKADDLLDPVDGARAGVLIAELADTFRGRHDDVRSLIVDSGRLSEALAANQTDIARFFEHSAVVNTALARSRTALARSIGQMADASSALVRMRADFEGLLREGPGVLDQVTSVVAPNAANLTCLLSDFGDLNSYMAEPEQIENLEEALRLNQYFFKGSELGAPRDPDGRVWVRIKFLAPNEKQPDSYLPDKRPIPDILPGAACASPLGAGVDAPSQPGYEPRVADAKFVAASDGDDLQSGTGVAPAMENTSANVGVTLVGLALALIVGVVMMGAVRRLGTIERDVQ